jgi:hypothetical protein
MKELLIKVVLDNEQKIMSTAINKNGFKDNLEDTLLIIGLLENLKSLELDKIKKKNQAKITYK